jgi:hypothetical protein
MGLYDLLQGQCKQQRAKDLCFFLPPAADWSRFAFTQQVRYANARMISESRCCDALVFTENEAIILMNFLCPIALAICFSPNATFTTDHISTQIDAHFVPPFDYCNQCRCWHRIPFVLGVDDPGNVVVLLSYPSPMDYVLNSSAGSVIRLRGQFTVRAILQDDHIFKEAIEFGTVFQPKCGKSLRFDPTKQDMDALSVRLSLFCVVALTEPALRLLAADSSRIAFHLLEVLGKESVGFTGCPRRCFVSMTVAVQLISSFARTKICSFEAKDD